MIEFSSTFGAADHPACPNCGEAMSVIRRSPSTAVPAFEIQTLRCQNCACEISRTVDSAGRIHAADTESTKDT